MAQQANNVLTLAVAGLLVTRQWPY